MSAETTRVIDPMLTSCARSRRMRPQELAMRIGAIEAYERVAQLLYAGFQGLLYVSTGIWDRAGRSGSGRRTPAF